jgi:hypothetical protein
MKGSVMKAQLRHTVAALMLLAPVAATFVAQPVAAQQRIAPQITGLTLNADNGLDPGSTLRLGVQGTPGGRATVQLAGTDIRIALRETSRGFYRGSYTIRRADRIDPTQFMTVRLTRSNVTTRQSFTYPPSFQALAMGAGPAPAPAFEPPRIDRFVTRPMGPLEPGRELRFRVDGAAGARVTLDIPGVVNDLPMREVGPGHYEATYTIRRRDDLDAFSTAIATLRSGDRWVTSRLERAVPRDRDGRAPAIIGMTPRHGDVVSPAGVTVVSADFDDRGGRGVDPNSVRIMLSGRDVTSDARVDSRGFTYRSDLPPGHYTAEVSARDFAGNVVNRSWSFDVGTSRVSGGALPLHVSSPSNGAIVDANGNLFVQGNTAPFASVRVRVDAVPPVIGQMLGVAQTVYNDTIQADRNGYFSVNVNPRIAAVPGMRYDVSLTAQQGSQTAESRITVHQRG